MDISEATARNWIKTKKVEPEYVNGKPFFTEQYIGELKDKLASADSKALKSRRNKRYVEGRMLYDDYLPADSINRPIVKAFLRAFEEMCDPEDAMDIVAYYMESMCILGHVSLPIYRQLVEDFSGSNLTAGYMIAKYRWLRKYDFVYQHGEDVLGYLYLSLKSLSERKAQGAYYTPSHVAKQVVDDAIADSCGRRHIKVLDPSCGTGNFLMQLPDYIGIDNVYGTDIDYKAVCIARTNMAMKYRVKDINILYKQIRHENFLSEFNRDGFDYVIGNPPWGYQYTEAEQTWLRERFKTVCNRGVESAFIFMERSYEVLNEQGKMLLIVPESILNVGQHRAIRSFLSIWMKLYSVTFLGEAFYGVQCPSVVLEFMKKDNYKAYCSYRQGERDENKKEHRIRIRRDGREYYIHEDDRISADCFDVAMDDDEYELLRKIYRTEHTTLEDNATFGLGIVTGDNDKHILSEQTEDCEPIIKGRDVDKYTIKQIEQYINLNPDELQQVAPEHIYRAPEKLVYGFIGDRIRFAYDDQGRLTLNSCNIVIPHIVGLHIKYIMAVLNSSVSEYICRNKFKSVKLLRSHIEQLPIPIPRGVAQEEIVRCVDELLANPDRYDELYDEIDRRIVSIVGLSAKEYELMKKKAPKI